MQVVDIQRNARYWPRMVASAQSRPRQKRGRPSREELATRTPRNRIAELARKNNLAYENIADLATEIRRRRGLLKDKKPVHKNTITRLASGDISLTLEWMETFAEIYHVPAHEIITKPIAEGLRPVSVNMTFQVGVWKKLHTWPAEQHQTVYVTDDPALRSMSLYGGELIGNSMNLRYPPSSILVLSRLENRPNEVEPGRRYHVEVERANGETEQSIRKLVKDGLGRFWLAPESSEPEFTAVPLDGETGLKVRLIGRVRFTVIREE